MQSEPQVNVLMVDDHPENLIALEAILDGLGQLVKAHSGEEALRCLLHQDFAVILLDVQMPGLDGFETAALIRQRERSRLTPIIFLTAFSTSDNLRFKGYSIGAVDYLLKPIEPEILTSKVSVFVDLYQKSAALKRQAVQLAAINSELRQSEERFRSLSACSPVGVLLFNNQGFCSYTNPRCQAICGFTLGESLGQGWTQFFYEDDRARALSDWTSYIGKGHEFLGEYRFQSAAGEIRWTQMRASPMYSDQGESIGYVGTIEDITERKAAEEARANFIREQVARQQAEAANRMKDEFLAVLSHELRTPLNSMLGWTRLLLTKKFDEERTTRALETIERNAKSQAQLIEDILDVSLIIRGKLRLKTGPLNLIPILEATVEAIAPQADAKKIQVMTHFDASADIVCGDAERLRQVVWNLLTNAIKFTPEGGTVQVRLNRWQDTDKKMNQTSHNLLPSSFLLHPSDYAQIQVSDSGIGIKPDFLPYVFDRFRQEDSTTTRQYGGLGLGLAIVRHIVELHSGTIAATSAGEGQGATFTIHLPLMKLGRSNSKASTEGSEPPRPELAGVQVLVVEDNDDTREFLMMLLQQAGAEVQTAASVAEALRCLETMQPDVLVSDIGMPEADGYQLIRQIHKLGLNIPAIALTAYAKQEEKHKALNAGFQIHLPKPVEPNELLANVASLAEKNAVQPSL